MYIEYDGQCRRIDLEFRSKYTYINTRIFKINKYKYSIYIIDKIENFDVVSKDFNYTIKYVTAPVELVNTIPNSYEHELDSIIDKNIPSSFEGFPMTEYQLFNHISSVYSKIDFSRILVDYDNHKIIIEVIGS